MLEYIWLSLAKFYKNKTGNMTKYIFNSIVTTANNWCDRLAILSSVVLALVYNFNFKEFLIALILNWLTLLVVFAIPYSIIREYWKSNPRK